MVTESVERVHRENAEAELRSIRTNCGKWPVSDNIQNLRNHLTRADLTLADIGTSEEELESCLKAGHKRSAQTWLQMARECCGERDVSFEIERVQSRLAEADLTPGDIGTSETELRELRWTTRRERR